MGRKPILQEYFFYSLYVTTKMVSILIYSFIGVQWCQKGNKEQANAPPKFVIFL